MTTELPTPRPSVGGAHQNDEEAIRFLLAHCGLPVEGLELAFPAGFVVARTDRVIGCAGIEVYGDLGLLRSVAVHIGHRRQAIGRELLLERLAEARRVGLTALYALTTTAPVFFARHGFNPIDRNSVPDGVRHSSQFATICSTTALVLCHPLTG